VTVIEIRSTSIIVFFVAAIQFILIDNYNVLVVLPGKDFIDISDKPGYRLILILIEYRHIHR